MTLYLFQTLFEHNDFIFCENNPNRYSATFEENLKKQPWHLPLLPMKKKKFKSIQEKKMIVKIHGRLKKNTNKYKNICTQ